MAAAVSAVLPCMPLASSLPSVNITSSHEVYPPPPRHHSPYHLYFAQRNPGVVAAKTKGLIHSLTTAFLSNVIGTCPAFPFDWRVGWTLYRLGFVNVFSLKYYALILEFVPAFFGAGILSGLDAPWSFREPPSSRFLVSLPS